MKWLIASACMLLIAGPIFSAPVDPDQESGVASQVFVMPGGGGVRLVVLATDGRIWYLERLPSGGAYEYGWIGTEGGWPSAVPVPVAEILDWTPWCLALRSGAVLVWNNVDLEWQTMGTPGQIAPLPGIVPVAPEVGSLGSVKSLFR